MLLGVATLSGCASGPRWKQQEFAFSVPSPLGAANTTSNVVALERVTISPLFQSRSFTYRIGENAYEYDPYASFLIAPERAFAESIRAWMNSCGVFGHVVGSRSGLIPDLIVEASVNQLYGDFRNTSHLKATMQVRFLFYRVKDDNQRIIVLDKACTRVTELTRKTPAALMAGWDTDLSEIMKEIASDYAEAVPKVR